MHIHLRLLSYLRVTGMSFIPSSFFATTPLLQTLFDDDSDPQLMPSNNLFLRLLDANNITDIGIDAFASLSGVTSLYAYCFLSEWTSSIQCLFSGTFRSINLRYFEVGCLQQWKASLFSSSRPTTFVRFFTIPLMECQQPLKCLYNPIFELCRCIENLFRRYCEYYPSTDTALKCESLWQFVCLGIDNWTTYWLTDRLNYCEFSQLLFQIVWQFHAMLRPVEWNEYRVHMFMYY